MNSEIILRVIECVLILLFGGTAYYFRVNSEIKTKANQFIAEAEAKYIDTVKAGGVKYQYVIDKLYTLVPIALKPLITKDVLAAMVDNAFQGIENYAKTQIDNVVGTLDKK